jgi:hypothetical protein
MTVPTRGVNLQVACKPVSCAWLDGKCCGCAGRDVLACMWPLEGAALEHPAELMPYCLQGVADVHCICGACHPVASPDCLPIHFPVRLIERQPGTHADLRPPALWALLRASRPFLCPRAPVSYLIIFRHHQSVSMYRPVLYPSRSHSHRLQPLGLSRGAQHLLCVSLGCRILWAASLASPARSA